MTDTLFLIGWRSIKDDRSAWTAIRYSHRYIPKALLEWLVDEEICHSFGIQGISPSREGKFLIIHDPNHAVAFRLRWNAKYVTIDELSERVRKKELLGSKFMLSK